MHAVLLRLPADARARCAAVCRAWRGAVADPALWEALDLTRAGGLTCACVDPSAVLPSLAPRLAPLRALRVQTSAQGEPRYFGGTAVLRAVLSLVRDGHAPALRELRLAGRLDVRQERTGEQFEQALRALQAAAHQLTLLEVEKLQCKSTQAAALLPLRGLRVRRVCWEPASHDRTVADAEIMAALGALAQHEALEGMTVQRRVYDPDVMACIVDVALARRLTQLGLKTVERTAAAPLARLVHESAALRRLSVNCDLHFDAPGAALLAAALRATSTLRELKLSGDTWLVGASDGVAAVCAALAGHPSLESLTCSVSCGAVQRVDYGALDGSMAALLRADARALTRLEVSVYFARPDGPVCGALPLTLGALAHNTRLRTLKVAMLMRTAFVGGTLLQAVRANTSLRRLSFGVHAEHCSEGARRAMAEAVRLVEARAAPPAPA